LPKHKTQHQYLFIARVKNEEEMLFVIAKKVLICLGRSVFLVIASFAQKTIRLKKLIHCSVYDGNNCYRLSKVAEAFYVIDKTEYVASETTKPANNTLHQTTFN